MLALLPLHLLLPRITIAFGGALFVLGLVAFFGTGMASLTALIPSGFGVVFGIIGLIGAANHKHRVALMWIASILAVVGMVPTARGLGPAFEALSGTTIERPEAAYTQALMFAMMLVYLLLNCAAFSSARKKAAAAK